jgi:O-antigen/teichoic acid export membrane protein
METSSFGAGVKWTTISSFGVAVSGVLKIAILTRYLNKEDFGLMAIASIFIGFVEIFSNLGISTAIIHKSDITKKEFSSLFWLSAILCVLFFLFFNLLIPFFSNFYGQEELNKILLFVSVLFLFNALGAHFKTYFQKLLNFKLLGIVEMFSAFISLIVAVYLSVNNFGVYSLVYASIVQYFLLNILFFIQGLRLKILYFHFDLSESLFFVKIGSYYMGGQIVNYFNRDLDVIIISKLFPIEALGLYSLAKQFISKPTLLINPIILKVGAPILALYQNNEVLLKKEYLKLLNLVATLNFIVYIAIFIFAAPIISIYYGNDYLEIVYTVRILSGYMVIRSISNPIGSLIVALGKTKLEFYWNLSLLIILPLFIWAGSFYGINGVAFGMFFSMIFLFYPAWYFLMKNLINISFLELMRHSFIPSLSYLKRK